MEVGIDFNPYSRLVASTAKKENKIAYQFLLFDRPDCFMFAVTKTLEFKPDNFISQGFLIFATGMFAILLNRNMFMMIFRKIKDKFINK